MRGWARLVTPLKASSTHQSQVQEATLPRRPSEPPSRQKLLLGDCLPAEGRNSRSSGSQRFLVAIDEKDERHALKGDGPCSRRPGSSASVSLTRIDTVHSTLQILFVDLGITYRASACSEVTN